MRSDPPTGDELTTLLVTLKTSILVEVADVAQDPGAVEPPAARGIRPRIVGILIAAAILLGLGTAGGAVAFGFLPDPFRGPVSPPATTTPVPSPTSTPTPVPTPTPVVPVPVDYSPPVPNLPLDCSELGAELAFDGIIPSVVTADPLLTEPRHAALAQAGALSCFWYNDDPARFSVLTLDIVADAPGGLAEIDEAVAIATELVSQIREMLAGCDWNAVLHSGAPRAAFTAVTMATNYLRDAANPLNAPELEGDRLANRFRAASGSLARAWALSSGRAGLAEFHEEIAFYEEVRVWMAKFDARDRQARDEPVPEEIERLLGGLVAEAMATGEVLDIYDAAGLPRLSLDDLGPEFLAKAQAAPNAHLAIEALRKSLVDAGSGVSQGNLIRQRAFSERIAEIMKRYTNQQLTAAEVIAALVELAKEVAAEASRGAQFTPPLSNDELAFYDAVAQNESAVTVQGEDVLAQIARELLAVMRRDVRTDWTVRDDVRAKLRSSIKRLLVRYKYPPDKQPGAIKLVMDQMESMAPRYADDRRANA